MSLAARKIRLIMTLRRSGITDTAVLAAIERIPREAFVPPARRAIAYLDLDVAVNEAGRALLKPMVFAKLLQAAGVTATDRVLDVGCATGYSAAVLGRLAGNVVALEEDAPLARQLPIKPARDCLLGDRQR